MGSKIATPLNEFMDSIDDDDHDSSRMSLQIADHRRSTLQSPISIIFKLVHNSCI